MRISSLAFKTIFIVGLVINLQGYPINAFYQTGIRRIERLRLILNGELPGTMPVKGAQLGIEEINLRLKPPDRKQNWTWA